MIDIFQLLSVSVLRITRLCATTVSQTVQAFKFFNMSMSVTVLNVNVNILNVNVKVLNVNVTVLNVNVAVLKVSVLVLNLNVVLLNGAWWF